MSTTKDPKPQGEMKLVNSFHESASSYSETSRLVVLSPGKGKTVDMEIVTDSLNLYSSGSRSESRSRWRISRDTLIELIKQNGKPIE